jgi:cyclic lactone autoinducer peptide
LQCIYYIEGITQRKEETGMVSEKKTSVALKAISYIAKKKANAACLGFAYEPDVPEKLKSMMDTKVKKEKN